MCLFNNVYTSRIKEILEVNGVSQTGLANKLGKTFNMPNLGIVVKCFQSERSSNQFLQFPRPPHQNYNFISVSGRFGRIICLFFMTRIQFPRKRFTLAEVSVSGSRQTRPSFYPIRQLHATMSLPNKKHRISVRTVQPCPF